MTHEIIYKFGNELTFVSQICRSGEGTLPVAAQEIEALGEVKMMLTRLSNSQDTFIAHEFNSYVVKLKK